MAGADPMSPGAQEKSSLKGFMACNSWKKQTILPPATTSDNMLIRIAPGDAGLFRYLLEGCGGHVALLTVLDPKEALLKLMFSPHQKRELSEFLDSARQTVDFYVLEWPFGGASSPGDGNAAPGPGMENNI